MKVGELSYKPKLGGSGHGTMMIHIIEGEPSGSSPSWEVMELVERCEQAVPMMNIKVPVVLLQPHTDTDHEEVTKLLMMLAHRGFTPGLIVTQPDIPLYIQNAKFVQVILTGTEWDNFRVNEIIYTPDHKAGDEIPEPIIHQNNVYCGKYIYMKKKDKVADYVSFIRTSQYLWALIVPPSREVAVDLSSR